MGHLNLHDIQGNILRGYNFGAGAHYFIEVPDAARGRALLGALLPWVTDARDWGSERPVIVTNVALTYAGLERLAVDRRVLNALPRAFTEPIRDRATREFGDDVGKWDDGIGTSNSHLLVLLASREGGGSKRPRLAAQRKRLDELLAHHGARTVHVQGDVQALKNQREHFGYADGFGQPAVEGVPNNFPGQGVPEQPNDRWRDVKTGEFILGYPDEDGDCVSGPAAWLLHNGSYMVYRKLEEDVSRFRAAVAEHARVYAATVCQQLSPQAAFELTAAKLVGRWRDGIALELEQGPDRGGQDLTKVMAEPTPVANDFRYEDDRDGYRCPRGAHVRRANPRDLLGTNTDESRRHRIIRRGMPYGPAFEDETGAGAETSGGGEANGGAEASAAPEARDRRGLIFMCFNADFERQFEVIQAQWCNSGNAFGLGEHQDFLLDNGDPQDPGQVTIEGKRPCFLRSAPGLVTTRGCEYLLMPGVAALRRVSEPMRARESELEDVPAGEPDAIARVVEFVTGTMHTNFGRSRPMLRGQHPKAHGCVEADFIVDGRDASDDLAVGLFGEEKTYRAWIRFSAGHSALQSDAKADAHGMAIKVVGVKGEGGKVSNHDFILVNYDVFFLRNAAEVADFARAITATGSVRATGLVVKLRTLGFFFGPDPRTWKPHGLWNLLRMIFRRVANPLALEYWSQVPYALGPYAVKYHARPLASPDNARIGADYDALEDLVAAALDPARASKYYFEFFVQRQADPRSMPVEDPTVRWKERDSPFRRVAIIAIDSQDVSDQARRNFGENLVFSPWHAPWDHRPLGGINRVRHAVYLASSDLRHRLNGAPAEPQ